MRDGERTELDFKAEQSFRGRVDRADRRRPAPWSASTLAAMRRSTPSRKVPVPTAGSASVTSDEASPAARSNNGPRRASIDEVDHRAHDFRRRVVGARELAQTVVVNFQKMLVEVEPGFGLVLAERRPVHFVQHARQRAERRFQRLLVGFVLGQNVERRADQRVRFLELDRAPVRRRLSEECPRRAPSADRRLPPAHSRRRIARRWLRETAACASLLQMLQATMARRHLLQNLLAQQATEARAGMR